ncbi:MAG TPA: hypothetical protein VI381_01990 [Allosphingosinicella sp.]
MRASFLFALILTAAGTPAAAEKLPNKGTPSPRDMLAQIGSGVSDEELARAVKAASAYPLGSVKNPVRVGGPEGESAYVARLRCAEGSKPEIGQRAPAGIGAYGTIVDRFPLDCKAAAPGKAEIVMDMYHEEHVETNAPPGLTLASE